MFIPIYACMHACMTNGRLQWLLVVSSACMHPHVSFFIVAQARAHVRWYSLWPRAID